jgi:hypothetical protein
MHIALPTIRMIRLHTFVGVSILDKRATAQHIRHLQPFFLVPCGYSIFCAEENNIPKENNKFMYLFLAFELPKIVTITILSIANHQPLTT